MGIGSTALVFPAGGTVAANTPAEGLAGLDLAVVSQPIRRALLRGLATHLASIRRAVVRRVIVFDGTGMVSGQVGRVLHPVAVVVAVVAFFGFGAELRAADERAGFALEGAEPAGARRRVRADRGLTDVAEPVHLLIVSVAVVVDPDVRAGLRGVGSDCLRLGGVAAAVVGG